MRIESFVCQDGRVYLLRPPLFFDYGIIAYYLQLIRVWQSENLFSESIFVEIKIAFPHVYEIIEAFVNKIRSDRLMSLKTLTCQDLINLIDCYSDLMEIKQIKQNEENEDKEEGIVLESSGDLENDFIGDLIAGIPNGMELLLNLDYQSVLDVLHRHRQWQPEIMQQRKDEQDKIKEEEKASEHLALLTQLIKRDEEQQWMETPPEIG